MCELNSSPHSSVSIVSYILNLLAAVAWRAKVGKAYLDQALASQDKWVPLIELGKKD